MIGVEGGNVAVRGLGRGPTAEIRISDLIWRKQEPLKSSDVHSLLLSSAGGHAVSYAGGFVELYVHKSR